MSSKPRRVIRGTCYLITRRCSERRFFLLPNPEVRQIFEYLLGLLSKKHKIEVHAFVVMSNHYHLVVTDTDGRLRKFQQELNSLLARSINAFRGRREAFWDRESYNAVELLGDEDVVSKMAYTLANPVAARLVNRAREWEGATSAEMAFGRPRTIARPKGFFGKRMPATVELELTRPRCHDGMPGGRLQQLIDQEVARREDEAMKLGRAMGMALVMRQDWRSSPDTIEERGAMRPTIAGANKWARIEALQRSKEWLRAYKEALAQFIAGNRAVEFPPGTWWMRERLRCNCASG